MKIPYKLLLLLVMATLLASCRCKQQAVSTHEPVYLNQRDSVRVEYIERVSIDTIRVEIPIPAQSASEIVRDSISIVETDFAMSVAKILPDGSLSHSIKNKEQKVGTDALVPMRETQAVETEYIYKDIPVKVPYAVEIEKKLTVWQTVRINSFWWMAGALFIAICWILRKRILKLF